MGQQGIDCTHRQGECMSNCRVYLEMKDGPKTVSNIRDGLRIRTHDGRYIDLSIRLFRGVKTRAVNDLYIYMSSGMYVLNCGSRQHRNKLVERIQSVMNKEKANV